MKKKILLTLGFLGLGLIFIFSISIHSQYVCVQGMIYGVISDTGFSCNQTLQTKIWRITWKPGNSETQTNWGTGKCGGLFTTTECPPDFEVPYQYSQYINGQHYQGWSQITYNRQYNGGISGGCSNVGSSRIVETSYPCDATTSGGGQECDPICFGGSPFADGKDCNAKFADKTESGENTSNLVDECCLPSPIVIDINGDGFNLTSASNGVMFDFNGDGVPHRISWTSPGSDDAWLVLDRDNNGTIDSSREMFGNMTMQPASSEKNGFKALAEYDKTENGGNDDGDINSQDTVFSSLRLWQDINHNGISESSELYTLPALDIVRMELRHKKSKKKDQYGNEFRYRAKVWDSHGARTGRWAWDVFLVLDTEQ